MNLSEVSLFTKSFLISVRLNPKCMNLNPCNSDFFLSSGFFFSCRETNLKFKMGLRVTDERLQEERQLAEFNGEPSLIA